MPFALPAQAAPRWWPTLEDFLEAQTRLGWEQARPYINQQERLWEKEHGQPATVWGHFDTLPAGLRDAWLKAYKSHGPQPPVVSSLLAGFALAGVLFAWAGGPTLLGGFAAGYAIYMIRLRRAITRAQAQAQALAQGPTSTSKETQTHV